MENNKITMEVPYFQIPNDIFEIGLDKYELLVYMYLARCGNQGQAAFPSYNKIAEKTGVSRRKAIDCVKSLEDKQLLIKEKRYNHERQENYTNVYRVEHKIENRGSAHHALGGAPDALGSACHAPYKEIDYKETKDKKYLQHSENVGCLHNSSNCENFLSLYSIDDSFIGSYLSIMNEYGYKHKRVNNKNFNYILDAIRYLENEGVEFSIWKETVYEHFDNLPKTNDGDIIAFLVASKRYFGIDLKEELY